jgi:hypothetical protein
MLPLAETAEPATDRMGVVDHIQERGKSRDRELGGDEVRFPAVPHVVPNRAKNSGKIDQFGYFIRRNWRVFSRV